MPQFRGRRGYRGASRSRGSDRIARSGIKTRSGYRKFDSQRVRDVQDHALESENHSHSVQSDNDSDIESASDEESEAPTQKSFSALLQSFQKANGQEGRPSKRRRIGTALTQSNGEGHASSDDEFLSSSNQDGQDLGDKNPDAEAISADEDQIRDEDDIELENGGVGTRSDPFEIHFADVNQENLTKRIQDIGHGRWRTEKRADGVTFSQPESGHEIDDQIADVRRIDEMVLKRRLLLSAKTHCNHLDGKQKMLAPYLSKYIDIMFNERTPQNAGSLRILACLHSINHILKVRDKVLKNNERISHGDSNDELDVRDQGFTRPKVLILLETRQHCGKYVSDIVNLFQPEQQENKKRFRDAFEGEVQDRPNKPEDFNELFEGNNDNNFVMGLKFTRKTLKFYSAFYSSDIILASPLGLRRIFENDDVKKRDYDFLSSIEIAIVDQADAMQMQNWQNVELVFEHLNCQLKEAHGCDFGRVRPWYLDGNAKYLRQTIVFSAYLTPEINKLYKSSMLNASGKVKFSPLYTGQIETSSFGKSQTFSRFDSISIATDPDDRFKYFTSAVLPSLLRTPQPADGIRGILIFIPSYYDFLRLRNFFATSTTTQDLSFGTIHDYSEISDQRRACSHFLTGRHAILLYTQRAHHFFRLKIRGVKRVVLYGPPDNPLFYNEIVGDFLATSISAGLVSSEESSSKCMFSKWDGFRLERIVGSNRIKGILGGRGDTFDFV